MGNGDEKYTLKGTTNKNKCQDKNKQKVRQQQISWNQWARHTERERQRATDKQQYSPCNESMETLKHNAHTFIFKIPTDFNNN